MRRLVVWILNVLIVLTVVVFVGFGAYPYLGGGLLNVYTFNLPGVPELVHYAEDLNIPYRHTVYNAYTELSEIQGTVPRDKDGISRIAYTDESHFYLRTATLDKMFLVGVNLGSGKPGAFPGEQLITKQEYLRWFKYISDMNCNTVRVYTLQMPHFYEALKEFNESSPNKLYLIHGVWVDDNALESGESIYTGTTREDFEKEIRVAIDILHGNIDLAKRVGHASGKYTADVSRYLVGYIIGVEWPPEMVIATNEDKKGAADFKGKYLYTEGASPFEVFLASVGDMAIDYQRETYQTETPLAFANWLTTDPLKHTGNPDEKEDMVEVDTEHIKSAASFKSGLFVSYHVYPYYPEFMNYQEDYLTVKDAEGKPNTYKAYLTELDAHHTRPLLVSEFGVPAARGSTHTDVNRGYNQGFVEETAQGQMLVSMLKDIKELDLAGGHVFTWQDEWFKRTWNTMDYDIADRRPYWNNMQTSEQHFGLMAFDSGADKSISYVDGDVTEWASDTPLIQGASDVHMSVKSDETYVYLNVRVKGFNLNTDKVYIPIDTLAGQGNTKWLSKGLDLGGQAEFVVSIEGKDNSRIVVDPYYDSYTYTYATQLGMLPEDVNAAVKNSGVFNPIRLALSASKVLPESKRVLPFESYETGKLLYGNGNPTAADFNSLADFYVKDNEIEIRIPWALLNVMDPSTKAIMGDLNLLGVKPKIADSFKFGLVLKRNGKDSNFDMQPYTWETWDEPTYHERLKSSYYIMQEYLKTLK